MALCCSCISHDADEADPLPDQIGEGGHRCDEPNPFPGWNISSEVRLDESSRPLYLDLFLACAAGSKNHTRMVLDSGADVNVRDYEERCPLHVAAAHGHVSVARMLLEARAEVNVFDYCGQSPLDRAKQANHNAIQKLLMKHGASLNKTHLHFQSERQKWEIRRKDVSLGDELSRTLKSVVYRGSWAGVDVVAKFCIDTSGDDPEDPEEELLHEIELLASVRHPDLVMFLGCSLKESPIMFITPYMPGGDLERYYRRKSEKTYSRWRPDLKTVTRWATQVLRALHFLHTCSQPIIHRDLKPLNILLTDTLDVKVSDFGMSKITANIREHKQDKVNDALSTRPRRASLRSVGSPGTLGSLGSVQSTYLMTGGVGSFRYMAPEVARHEVYSEKVDIFSFALVLYFMSSGRHPFSDFRDPAEILRQYSLGKEPRPSASDCPSVLRPTMQSAWDSDPKSRPSAGDLLRNFADVQSANCRSTCSPM